MSKQGQIPLIPTRGSPSPAVPRPVAFVRGLFVLSGVLSAAYVSANGRELTAYTTGLALVAMATMLPFAVLVRRARPWARSGMIVTCVILIALAVILIAADAAVTPAGNLAAGWLAVLHYATSSVILVAAIGGVVGLIGADAGEYFRRHQQVAADDARLWPIAQLRNLHAARPVGARIGVGVVRSLQSASPIDVVAPLPAGRPSASEAFARAA